MTRAGPKLGKMAVLKEVRAALEHEPRINLHRYPIDGEFQEGELVLEGEVEHVGAKKLTLELAAAIPEVGRIVDRLRVAPANPMGDGQVLAHVRDALLQEPALEQCAIQLRAKGRAETTIREPIPERSGSIELEVGDGAVFLNGGVPSLSHKRLAGALASWVPGSRDVINGLEVDPPEEDNDNEVVDAEAEELAVEPSEEGEDVEETGPLTPLNLYLKEVASVPLLSREQEVELGRKQDEAKSACFAEIFSIPCSWRLVLEIGDSVEKGEWSIGDALVEMASGQEKQKERSFLERMTRLRQLTQASAEGQERSAVKKKGAAQTSSAKRDEILEAIKSLELADSCLGDIAQKVKDAVVRLANLEKTDPAGGEIRVLEKEVGLTGAEAERRLRSITEAEDRIASARRELANANLRLVLRVAKRHAHREIPLLDIIQLGNMGLMRAAEKFDHRRGYRFSTYAVPWIRQSIARGIVDTVPTIRIPAHLAETRNKILRSYARLRQELGREPEVHEIVGHLDMPAGELRDAMGTVGEPVSLQTPIGEGEEASLIDFIEDPNGPEPLERVLEDEVYAKVQDALAVLSEREENIVRLRFGIGEPREYTLEEVGEVFSLKRERIRQLEQIAVRKLFVFLSRSGKHEPYL